MRPALLAVSLVSIISLAITGCQVGDPNASPNGGGDDDDDER